MHRALVVRLLGWAQFAVMAVMAALYFASVLGGPLPHGWVVSAGDVLVLGMLLLMFQVRMWSEKWAEQRLAAGAVDQLGPLAEENARLKAEAAQSAREAEQARQRLEVELRSLRLAYEDLRREQLARSPSQGG